MDKQFKTPLGIVTYRFRNQALELLATPVLPSAKPNSEPQNFRILQVVPVIPADCEEETRKSPE